MDKLNSWEGVRSRGELVIILGCLSEKNSILGVIRNGYFLFTGWR